MFLLFFLKQPVILLELSLYIWYDRNVTMVSNDAIMKKLSCANIADT